MNWVNFSFIIVMAIGLLLFFYGLKKKSVMSMFVGGSALLALILYSIGWTYLLPFAPIVSMAISLSVKKKVNTT